MNSALVYKSLRCLTKFCEHKKLSSILIEKGGHEVTIDLVVEFNGDVKIVFQALKVLMKLIQTYPEKIQDFAFAGIPEKIIQAYDEDWPIEIDKKVIEMFSAVAVMDDIKNVIAEQFLEDLMNILKNFFENRRVVRHATKLLAICSDNITSV